MSARPFSTLREFTASAGTTGRFHSLPALAEAGFPHLGRLPVSLRIMLESLLRNRDGQRISDEHIQRLAGWQPRADREDEIPFVVARIVLQDFTGVPLLADLAAMRGVAGRFGQDPAQIEPLVPVDLVVDHSVQVDHFREPNALDLNMRLEFRPQRRALPLHQMGHAGLRHLPRGAAGHRHRASGEPGIPGPRGDPPG
jgi:aconitate hydratase